MKKTIIMTAMAAAITIGAPALADHHEEVKTNTVEDKKADNADMKSGNMSATGEANMSARAKVATTTKNDGKLRVAEKDNRGKVTKVEYNGTVYPVCTGDNDDSCINPYAAGLKWGNRPLGYWPGQPASEM